MTKKILSITMLVMMIATIPAPSASAVGAKAAMASLILPTTGQAMNGQLETRKSGLMAGLEVAGVTLLAVLGGVIGGPVVWVAAGPLIANHVWSSVDAYKGAQNRVNPLVQQQMLDAHKTLEYSRQRRFDREAASRSSVRDRILQAGELAAKK